ncbi:hypothetical protein PanWU01x14_371830, partial [Parasponia andersonii]
IPREMNQKADELTKSASTRGTGHAEILLEDRNTGDPPKTPRRPPYIMYL